MAFILHAFFHGRNVTKYQFGAKNYTDSISQNHFLSQHSVLYSLSHHTSESISLCPQLCMFALLKHHMLVSFIANAYFTTFPALEREEGQTSSIVNFLQEHSLESMPHRKPHSHTHSHAVGGWGGSRGGIIYYKSK